MLASPKLVLQKCQSPEVGNYAKMVQSKIDVNQTLAGQTRGKWMLTTENIEVTKRLSIPRHTLGDMNDDGRLGRSYDPCPVS